MSNKLTLNKMKSIVSNPVEPTVVTYWVDNGEDVNIEFKTDLSVSDVSVFVDTVVDGVFTYADEYVPEYKDIYMFFALINISNIPIPKKKTKDGESIIDVKTVYEWMNNTGIIHRLKNQDETLGNLLVLYNKLNEIIADKIEFKKQEVLSAHKVALENATFETQKLIDTFSSLGEQFENINLNELVDNTKKIAEKDEKELANAIIDINSNKDKDE